MTEMTPTITIRSTAGYGGMLGRCEEVLLDGKRLRGVASVKRVVRSDHLIETHLVTYWRYEEEASEPTKPFEKFRGGSQ